ncbi:MAG TPA: hypothetical protein VHC21_00535 [Candidatus Saccharimonadales bacterium]|nr:hypothetical protein [Candidatus Saccharimonadales bacterium]
MITWQERKIEPVELGSCEAYGEDEWELEVLFEELMADEYIKEIRKPAFGNGRVDIEAIAKIAGVDLEFIPIDGYRGYYYPEAEPCPLVQIDAEKAISSYDLEETFGHEIGHHFLYYRSGPLGRQNFCNEDFCDYFAEKLVYDRCEPRAGQLALFRGTYGEDL